MNPLEPKKLTTAIEAHNWFLIIGMPVEFELRYKVTVSSGVKEVFKATLPCNYIIVGDLSFLKRRILHLITSCETLNKELNIKFAN